MLIHILSWVLTLLGTKFFQNVKEKWSFDPGIYESKSTLTGFTLTQDSEGWMEHLDKVNTAAD
jgi:hypothetical protein